MEENKVVNEKDIDYVGIGGILSPDRFEENLLDFIEKRDKNLKPILCILLTEYELYDYRLEDNLKKAIEFAKSKGFDEKDIKIDLYYYDRRNIYKNQDIDSLKADVEKLGYKDIESGVYEGCHFSAEQSKKAFNYVRKSATEIKKLNLSPLESMLYLYTKIKHHSYKEEEKTDHWSASRTLIGVVSGKFNKIVCAGYSRLIYAIITELNNPNLKTFENSIETKYRDGKTGYHRNNVIYIKDDKYKIEGFYYADVTWDSSKYTSNSLRYFLLPLNDLSYFKDVNLITKNNNSFSFSGETAKNLFYDDMTRCLFASKKYKELIKNAYFKTQNAQLGDNFDRIVNNYETISDCFDLLKLAGIRFLPKSNFLAKKAVEGTISKTEANDFLQKELERSNLEKEKDYVMLKVLDFMKTKIKNCERNVDLNVVVALRRRLDNDKEFTEKLSAYGVDKFVDLLLVQDNFAHFSEDDLYRVLSNFEEIFNEDVCFINKSYLEKISKYDMVINATTFDYNKLKSYVKDYPNNVYRIMKNNSSDIHLKDIMDSLYSIGKALNDKTEWSKVYRCVEKIVNQNISYASNVFENSIELKNPFAQAKFYDDKAWREKFNQMEQDSEVKEN